MNIPLNPQHSSFIVSANYYDSPDFRDCSRDPTEVIEARLRRLLHTFLQNNRETAANDTQGINILMILM